MQLRIDYLGLLDIPHNGSGTSVDIGLGGGLPSAELAVRVLLRIARIHATGISSEGEFVASFVGRFGQVAEGVTKRNRDVVGRAVEAPQSSRNRLPGGGTIMTVGIGVRLDRCVITAGLFAATECD